LEQVGIHQRVVEDNFGVAEQFSAAQGEEAGIARSGSNEINFAFGFHPPNLSELP
jgi:hypothetical protein